MEANLDIQYMMGVAPSVPTTYWSIAANSTLEIGKFIAVILNRHNMLPQMIFFNGLWQCPIQLILLLSTHFRMACLNVMWTLTWARVRIFRFQIRQYLSLFFSGYVLRSDTEFKKLAVRGITIIIADGDAGAGDLGEPPMSVPSCMKTLNPDWPSQSPVSASRL